MKRNLSTSVQRYELQEGRSRRSILLLDSLDHVKNRRIDEDMDGRAGGWLIQRLFPRLQTAIRPSALLSHEQIPLLHPRQPKDSPLPLSIAKNQGPRRRGGAGWGSEDDL